MKDHWTAYMVISFMICTSMHKIEVIASQRNRQLPIYRAENRNIVEANTIQSTDRFEKRKHRRSEKRRGSSRKRGA